jgi:hypothetical protein
MAIINSCNVLQNLWNNCFAKDSVHFLVKIKILCCNPGIIPLNLNNCKILVTYKLLFYFKRECFMISFLSLWSLSLLKLWSQSWIKVFIFMKNGRFKRLHPAMDGENSLSKPKNHLDVILILHVHCEWA